MKNLSSIIAGCCAALMVSSSSFAVWHMMGGVNTKGMMCKPVKMVPSNVGYTPASSMFAEAQLLGFQDPNFLSNRAMGCVKKSPSGLMSTVYLWCRGDYCVKNN